MIDPKKDGFPVTEEDFARLDEQSSWDDIPERLKDPANYDKMSGRVYEGSPIMWGEESDFQKKWLEEIKKPK